DAHIEPAGVARGDIRLYFPAADLRVHDRGDAGSQELLQCKVELLGGNVRRLGQVNVGTMVADLDPVGAGEQVAGGVPEKAIRGPVRVAADLTAPRRRCLRADAMSLQPETVHAAAMTADVHHVDLAVDRCAIEVCGLWLSPLGEPAIVVAKAAQWRTRRQTARVLGEH